MQAIGHLLTVLIIQPIFNLLVFITAILPGHNFGLAVIIFTLIVRLAMWPLVKKQLHHTRVMQKLQPELKKIKASAGGDRQKESRLMMELYKERGVSPFSSLGIVLVQLPIFIGLYLGVRRIILDPQDIVNFSYPLLHHLGWIQQLMGDIHRFDPTLFGIIDLTKHGVANGGLYWPAILISAVAGGAQYFQSKQLMPQTAERRRLKDILGDAGKGKQADQQELSAAVGRSTLIFIPFMVFIFGLGFPAALPLYWLMNSSVAYFQQARVLGRDEEEMESVAEKPEPKAKSKKASKNKKRGAKNKRRRRR